MAMPKDKKHLSDVPNFTCMSRGEIVSAMRGAKNPAKQKRFLPTFAVALYRQ